MHICMTPLKPHRHYTHSRRKNSHPPTFNNYLHSNFTLPASRKLYTNNHKDHCDEDHHDNDKAADWSSVLLPEAADKRQRIACQLRQSHYPSPHCPFHSPPRQFSSHINLTSIVAPKPVHACALVGERRADPCLHVVDLLRHLLSPPLQSIHLPQWLAKITNSVLEQLHTVAHRLGLPQWGRLEPGHQGRDRTCAAEADIEGSIHEVNRVVIDGGGIGGERGYAEVWIVRWRALWFDEVCASWDWRWWPKEEYCEKDSKAKRSHIVIRLVLVLKGVKWVECNERMNWDLFIANNLAWSLGRD